MNSAATSALGLGIVQGGELLRAFVDRQHIRVHGPCGRLTLDLLIESRRVWSFSVNELHEGQGLQYAWPANLRPYLRGTGTVQLRRSADDALVAEAEVVFDDEVRRVAVVDESGRHLCLNKWGVLAYSFENSSQEMADRLLDSVDKILADLRAFGLDGFLAYGSLLGAVRQGTVLPHDDDADVAYVSSHETTCDVVLEQIALTHFLRQQGHDVRVHSLGHLQVQVALSGVKDHYLDVFTMVVSGSFLILALAVRARASIDMILPLSTVQLSGRSFPAPRDPEGLLAATYGENWRIPDRGFQFTPPMRTWKVLHSRTGAFVSGHGYWNHFYSSAECLDVPQEGSAFSAWVDDRLPEGAKVLELGCGTGRDALAFASAGRRVHAIDRSAESIQYVEARSAGLGIPLTTGQVNLTDLSDVLGLLGDLPASGPWHLYARFFLHAIDDEARANFWMLARAIAREGGGIWLEFRTARDAERNHEFPEHYRNFLRLPQVLVEADDAGLKAAFVAEGTGFAPFRGEDPVVARLMLAAADGQGDSARSLVDVASGVARV